MNSVDYNLTTTDFDGYCIVQFFATTLPVIVSSKYKNNQNNHSWDHWTHRNISEATWDFILHNLLTFYRHYFHSILGRVRLINTFNIFIIIYKCLDEQVLQIIPLPPPPFLLPLCFPFLPSAYDFSLFPAESLQMWRARTSTGRKSFFPCVFVWVFTTQELGSKPWQGDDDKSNYQ